MSDKSKFLLRVQTHEPLQLKEDGGTRKIRWVPWNPNISSQLVWELSSIRHTHTHATYRAPMNTTLDAKLLSVTVAMSSSEWYFLSSGHVHLDLNCNLSHQLLLPWDKAAFSLPFIYLGLAAAERGVKTRQLTRHNKQSWKNKQQRRQLKRVDSLGPTAWTPVTRSEFSSDVGGTQTMKKHFLILTLTISPVT